VLRGDRPNRAPQPGLDELPALLDGARLSGLDVDMTEVGVRRAVPADLAAAVYRIVQEAVTNTVKHAAATRLGVRLDWGPATVTVEVTDNGSGPVTTSPVSGRGLVGMRERVHAFGGVLHAGPNGSGDGFRVAATLPLPESSTVDGGGDD
jgi:signal transduction histidine kinase